jgi:transcriptional regulator with XRE-family HTH domain
MAPNLRQSAETVRQDGAVLRELRIQHLLTLPAAAEKIGCHYKTLQYLEHEQLGASEIMLEKIARAYGVRRAVLMKQAA